MRARCSAGNQGGVRARMKWNRRTRHIRHRDMRKPAGHRRGGASTAKRFAALALIWNDRRRINPREGARSSRGGFRGPPSPIDRPPPVRGLKDKVVDLEGRRHA
ncbi:hypothetical protein RSO01_77950 [Reyranella soli]|uniref:Uncharacterized protein n=1 Tax=Reyranella soli TaxID=1230389 RepID=A0A512NNX7_9HYPH|nr:hypothetical protein RSO01_77950 [Reyranella soli]